MSRTMVNVPVKTTNINEVLRIFEKVLQRAGYKQKIVDGETVWAKGDGVMMKMQCVSATFASDSVMIQGWMKDAITGESNLEGFVAGLPKKKMKALIEEIRTTIISEGL